MKKAKASMSSVTATAISDETIREIVRRVLTATRPDKIILFGSAATGAMTPDSDIDLLLVQSVVRDRNAEYVRVRQALGDMGFPFDILLLTTEWFEASKDVIGGIAYPAHKHGRVFSDAA